VHGRVLGAEENGVVYGVGDGPAIAAALASLIIMEALDFLVVQETGAQGRSGPLGEILVLTTPSELCIEKSDPLQISSRHRHVAAGHMADLPQAP
jgi:hypothetical protein